MTNKHLIQCKKKWFHSKKYIYKKNDVEIVKFLSLKIFTIAINVNDKNKIQKKNEKLVFF